MADKNLPVPYKSQHDSDSYISNNDCGPASLAMGLEFLGTPISVGEVLSRLGNPKGFTSFGDLAAVAQGLGYAVETKVDAPFSTIQSFIDRGLPVIVVGGYKYLNSRQDKNFNSSHIMLVVGYRDDGTVFANDPDFWGDMRTHGDHHAYTEAEFSNFWRNEGNTEGNKPNTLMAIVPKDKVTPSVSTNDLPKIIEVIPTVGMRLRTQPQINAQNIAASVEMGQRLEVNGKADGNAVDGTNNLWYQVKHGGKNLFIWSGGVRIVEMAKKEEPAKVATPPAKPIEKLNEDYLKGILAIYKMSRDILKTNNALPDEKESDGFWAKLLKTLRP